MAINVLFAMAQFVLFYVDRDLSLQLGPQNLSKMLWGDYATDTNTNFYEIFYFSRVSGFSREAGFFSSLLVASFVADIVRGTTNRKMIVLYCIGLFISFSKSSFVFVIFAALYPLRHRIRTVHPLVVLLAYTGSLRWWQCIWRVLISSIPIRSGTDLAGTPFCLMRDSKTLLAASTHMT
jgi:hypothetical protein